MHRSYYLSSFFLDSDRAYKVSGCLLFLWILILQPEISLSSRAIPWAIIRATLSSELHILHYNLIDFVVSLPFVWDINLVFGDKSWSTYISWLGQVGAEDSSWFFLFLVLQFFRVAWAYSHVLQVVFRQFFNMLGIISNISILCLLIKIGFPTSGDIGQVHVLPLLAAYPTTLLWSLDLGILVLYDCPDWNMLLLVVDCLDHCR